MTFGSEDIGAGRFFIWTVEIFISTIIFAVRASVNEIYSFTLLK